MKNALKSLIIFIFITVSLIIPFQSAKAWGIDIGFITLKATQYFAFWQSIRGELNRLSDRINQEVLTANKTDNPNGEPAYIEYWRDFIGESQFRGENVFRVELNNAEVCSYIKETLQTIYGISNFEYNGRSGLPPGFDTKAASVRLHPYELVSKCTLATIEGNASNNGSGDKDAQNKYLEDWIFSADPLASFVELSKTQNNFYGAYLLADKEFKDQASFERQKDVLEALANDGFTGTKNTGDSDQEGCIKDDSERCVVLGKNQTPGGVLAAGAKKVIEAEFDIITSRNEGQFRSVLTSLIQKFLSFNATTGVEGDLDNISIPSISALSSEEGTGYTTDFRDAKNYSACIRACDELFKPEKPEGCDDSQIGQCTRCIGTNSEGDGNFECVLWATVECEGIAATGSEQKCEIQDDKWGLRSACYENCGNRWLWPDQQLSGGRCGVNFPQPQCACEAIDPSVTYQYADTVIGIQQRLIASQCSTIGVLCDDRGPHGLGKLEGGLNTGSATQYMNALVSAINSGSSLTASYEFFGDEPILAVFDGEKTEYYDVITSSGNVWNNGGKVICTPDRLSGGSAGSGGAGGSGGSGGGSL